MAVKIQIKRFSIHFRPNQKPQHPDDLSALFVNCAGIKIVDFNIFTGPWRVGQRAAIFAKLIAAQTLCISNTFDGRVAHIASELLIAKHR